MDLLNVPNQIQSQEYSRGSGLDGISHIGLAGSERQPQRLVPKLERWRVVLELQLA